MPYSSADLSNANSAVWSGGTFNELHKELFSNRVKKAIVEKTFTNKLTIKPDLRGSDTYAWRDMGNATVEGRPVGSTGPDAAQEAKHAVNRVNIDTMITSKHSLGDLESAQSPIEVAHKYGQIEGDALSVAYDKAVFAEVARGAFVQTRPANLPPGHNLGIVSTIATASLGDLIAWEKAIEKIRVERLQKNMSMDGVVLFITPALQSLLTESTKLMDARFGPDIGTSYMHRQFKAISDMTIVVTNLLPTAADVGVNQPLTNALNTDAANLAAFTGRYDITNEIATVQAIAMTGMSIVAPQNMAPTSRSWYNEDLQAQFFRSRMAYAVAPYSLQECAVVAAV